MTPNQLRVCGIVNLAFTAYQKQKWHRGVAGTRHLASSAPQGPESVPLRARAGSSVPLGPSLPSSVPLGPDLLVRAPRARITSRSHLRPCLWGTDASRTLRRAPVPSCSHVQSHRCSLHPTGIGFPHVSAMSRHCPHVPSLLPPPGRNNSIPRQ